MTQWQPRYETLEHWRGLGALWVMIFHAFAVTYDQSVHPVVGIIRAIAAPGWLGVHLFFVISGYCIAASVDKLIAKAGTAGQFFKDRFWRLFPPYWASLGVALIINLAAAPFNATSFWSNLPSSPRAWIGNLLLIQPYLNVPYYVIVYWSLVFEIGFYIIIATLVVLAQKTQPRPAIYVGIALASLSLLNLPAAYFLGIGGWAEFICGFLVYIALKSQFHGYSYRRNGAIALICVLGLLGISGNQFLGSGNKLWFSAIFALLLYILRAWDLQIASFKPLAFLKWAGVMSYSLYLLHVPLESKVINLGIRWVAMDSLLMLPLQICGWSVALVGSYLFYQSIEKPANDWRYRQRKSKLSVS